MERGLPGVVLLRAAVLQFFLSYFDVVAVLVHRRFVVDSEDLGVAVGENSNVNCSHLELAASDSFLL